MRLVTTKDHHGVFFLVFVLSLRRRGCVVVKIVVVLSGATKIVSVLCLYVHDKDLLESCI